MLRNTKSRIKLTKVIIYNQMHDFYLSKTCYLTISVCWSFVVTVSHAVRSTYPLLVFQQLLRLVLIQLLGAVRSVSAVVPTDTNTGLVFMQHRKGNCQVNNHIMCLFSSFKWPCKGLPWVSCHAFSAMLETRETLWLRRPQRAETGDVYMYCFSYVFMTM